jgi:hypothetical protein
MNSVSVTSMTGDVTVSTITAAMYITRDTTTPTNTLMGRNTSSAAGITRAVMM